MLKMIVVQGPIKIFERKLQTAMEQGYEPLTETKNTISIFDEGSELPFHTILCQKWTVD